MSNRKNVTNKPSLRTLSFALRNKALWPNGFEWNYGGCHTCAMGLAKRLWPDDIGQPTIGDMMVVFGINCRFANELFCSTDPSYRDVTPEMVADRIDRVMPE